MGINATNRTARQNVQVQYSAVLGGLYISNPVSEAILGAAKAEIGADVWKKGFDGLSEGSTSSRVRQLVDKPEFLFAQNGLTGRIFSVGIKEVEGTAGSKFQYLNVGLKDDDEGATFWISIALDNDGAQMLVRKLHAVSYGTWVSVNVFATYDKKPGAERSYSNHCASVRVDDKQVEGVDPREVLVGLRESQKETLAASRIKLDPAAMRTQMASVDLDYHSGLVDDIVKRFVAEKEAAKASQPA